MNNWTNHKPTIEWLKGQPLWHTKDMTYAVLVGIVIGLVIGLLA